MHAEAYPEIWYGIWSGPDTYNSVLSKYPGQTMFIEHSPDDHRARWNGAQLDRFSGDEYAPTRLAALQRAKLLGLEFQEKGVSFQPTLPLAEYEFTSPLLGFKKSKDGYSGWYAPSVAGRWIVRIQAPGVGAGTGLRQVKVNGQRSNRRRNRTRESGSGARAKPGTPLRWEIS